MLAVVINHICYPRTLPPSNYLGWHDWQHGRKGIDTDYWDRNTCEYDAPTTPQKTPEITPEPTTANDIINQTHEFKPSTELSSQIIEPGKTEYIGATEPNIQTHKSETQGLFAESGTHEFTQPLESTDSIYESAHESAPSDESVVIHSALTAKPNPWLEYLPGIGAALGIAVLASIPGIYLCLSRNNRESAGISTDMSSPEVELCEYTRSNEDMLLTAEVEPSK
jgi:hypothetical protein